jgi:hypothetical protein
VVLVRQGHEAGRVQPPVTDLVRSHLRERFPGDSRGKPDADAVLDGLPFAHRGAGGRPIVEVVARIQQVHLALHDRGLRGAHPGEDRSKVFLVHGNIAGAGALGPGTQNTDQHPHDDETDRSQTNLPSSTHVHDLLDPT